jgi:hypothetical protein
MTTNNNLIKTDSEAIAALERSLKSDGVTTQVTILDADAGESPARVLFNVSPRCKATAMHGIYLAKINRRTGSVFAVDDEPDYHRHDEHEED